MVNLQEKAESYLRMYVREMEGLETTIKEIGNLLRSIDATNGSEEIIPQETYDGLNAFLAVLRETKVMLSIPNRIGYLKLYLGRVTERRDSGNDDPRPGYWDKELLGTKQRIDDLTENLVYWMKKPIDQRVAPLVLSSLEIVPSSVSEQQLSLSEYQPLKAVSNHYQN